MVVPCLVVHQLDHLIVLLLNFFFTLWLAIGLQDIAGVRQVYKKYSMFHLRKGEASGAEVSE